MYGNPDKSTAAIVNVYVHIIRTAYKQIRFSVQTNDHTTHIIGAMQNKIL